ncbi:MAG TPA: AI-2E family transporter [Acidobacteriaceae bacterium]|nr:AI-2E family transporter [Acidobacteriaceae bacterium]
MPDTFRSRALFSGLICVAAVVTLVIFWNGRYILLLLFAGIVGAVLLSRPTEWVQSKLRIRRIPALIIVLVAISAVLGGLAALRGAALLQQLGTLQTDIPQAAQEIMTRLNGQPWGRWLTSELTNSARSSDGLTYAISGLRSVMTQTALTLAGLVVVLFTSIFVAAEPQFYLRGLRRLTPVRHRVLLELGLEKAKAGLEAWLMAKLLSMVVIGVMVAAGLWILRVPLPGTLGVIAGILTFIPNLGPVVSVIPAALLAFAISPARGALTLALFGLVHFLEGNVVTPLAERKIVTLPPAVTLTLQLLLASVTGAMGIAMAAPVAAVLLSVLNAVLPAESSNTTAERQRSLRPAVPPDHPRELTSVGH